MSFSIVSVIETEFTYSDEQLITIWHAGENWAFDVLYKRYIVDLLSVAVRKTGDRDDAEEIVQDVFLEVYRLGHRLEAKQGIKSYLYRSLRNRVFNYFRNESVQQRYLESIKTQPLTNNATEEQINFHELERLLAEQIDTLPTQCQTVFRLSREKNLSHKEIASQLGISVNTVEQHIRKALKIIRSGLSDYISTNGMLLFILVTYASPY